MHAETGCKLHLCRIYAICSLLFRKKDKNYLDTLLNKLKEKDFDGIVMIEFVSGNSEKSFFKDTEILKSY